jgi:hypothetical protein
VGELREQVEQAERRNTTFEFCSRFDPEHKVEVEHGKALKGLICSTRSKVFLVIWIFERRKMGEAAKCLEDPERWNSRNTEHNTEKAMRYEPTPEELVIKQLEGRLRFLHGRINSDSDPTVQRFIKFTQEEIATAKAVMAAAKAAAGKNQRRKYYLAKKTRQQAAE